VLVLAIAAVLVTAGCDDGGSPSRPPGAPEPGPADSLRGFWLWSLEGEAIYHEFGSSSSGPLFYKTGDTLSVVTEFTSARGTPVRPEEMGTDIDLELSADAETCLEVIPLAARYAFHLRAASSGWGRLGVRLRRGDTVLYESPGAPFEVVDPGVEAWAPLDPRNAPDGPVVDLVTHEGRLIVAGDFSRVGATEAQGVAAWDGAAWTPLGTGLAGVQHLESDDERLVAAGDFGFRRWTGLTWVEMAPPLEGVLAWTLDQGTVAATGNGIGVLLWQDGAWQPLLPTQERLVGEALAVHEGQLYFAGYSLTGPMQFVTGFLRRRNGSSWTTLHEEACSDLCSYTASHLKSLGTELVYAWGIGSPGGDFHELDRVTGVAREEIARDWVTASARFGGRTAFANRDIVYLQETAGLRPILEIGHGGTIHDLESFDGLLVLAGDFETVDGTPAPFLARWRP